MFPGDFYIDTKHTSNSIEVVFVRVKLVFYLVSSSYTLLDADMMYLGFNVNNVRALSELLTDIRILVICIKQQYVPQSWRLTIDH